MNHRKVSRLIVVTLLLILSGLGSSYIHAQSTRKNAPAQWSVYEQIARQATDHSAFDAVMNEARQAATTAEQQEYDAKIWSALKELIKNGTTASGQFDLTPLIGENQDVQEFFNQQNATVAHSLKDMPAGQYTVKVQAFARTTDYLGSLNQYEAGKDLTRVYLMFGTLRERIKNIQDDARYQMTRLDSDCQGAFLRHVPNSLSGAKAAFDAGLYWNVFRTELASDGNVSLSVKLLSGATNNWFVCGAIKLYYGTPAVDVKLAQARKYNITEDTYANVTSDIQLKPDTYNTLSIPFDMDAAQTASAFKAVYQLGSIETNDANTLTGHLVPVSEIKAGESYFVTVDKETTLQATDVLLRALRPDSVPAIWRGGAMKGNYFTRGYNATVYYNPELQSKAKTITWQPMDYNDISFSVNLENIRAHEFLASGVYTETSQSVINKYTVTPPVRRDQPAPVVIPVPNVGKALKLTLSNNSDLSNAWAQSIRQGITLWETYNLVPARTYYYKVEAGDSLVSQGHFNTEGQLRMLKASSISNIRDLGGWVNTDGNTIRYEKLYRGSEMNGTQVINTYDLRRMQAVGIKAEIDLRSTYNVGGTPTTSPLGSGVQFHFANLARWSDNTLQLDVTNWRNAINFLITNVKAGRPTYFHCQVGADRTGLLAVLIEGVLGFSRDQMYHDYELTSWSQAGYRNKSKIDPAVNYIIQSTKGTTQQEHFFNFITQKLGVSATELRDFINVMVDGESSMLRRALAFAATDGSYFESLTDIYATCPVGTKIASGVKAQLQTTDGDTQEVTMKAEGLMVTFAASTLEPGTTYTLTIPAGGVILPDGEKAQDAPLSLTFRTPDTFATEFYLFAPSLNKFIGRGANFGVRTVADNFGLPVTITTDTDGSKFIKFIDNGLCISHDGFGDRSWTATNLKWTVETTDDGLLLRASNGKYMTLSGSVFSATATTADRATLFVAKTAAEQKAIVQQLQFDNNMEAARRAGVTDATTFAELSSALSKYTTSNLTGQIKNATSGSTSSWSLTEPADSRAASAQAYNTGNYGGELFNKHGYVSQTVTVPKAGLYKITATILSRQGSNASCYALGRKGFALSNAYISVNDKYWAQIPDWYSAAAGSANPDNTGQAKSLMDSGKYRVELYAYADANKRLTIKINQPAYTVFVWCVFNNFTLTYIDTGNENTGEEDPEETTYPEAGSKGYLYNLQAGKFINADAKLDDKGVRFTIVSETTYEGGWDKNGNVFTDPEGRTFPTVRFTTEFTDPERDNQTTMLSCRADDHITATTTYGYGVFPLYYVEGKGLLIFCFYNKSDADFYGAGRCLTYDAAGNLVFRAEADATYWKWVSEAEYKKMTGQDDDPDPVYPSGEGYSDLTPDMFMHWDDDSHPTAGEPTGCSYHIGEGAVTVYGDESLAYLNFADLSAYDKLIIYVTEGTPRLFFNKVDGGKYNANDEAASGRIEITPSGGWAARYYTVVDGVWTIDLHQMVADKGYAHLNGIKGPTYDTTVTVAKMLLFKDTASGIDAVTGSSSGGSKYPEGIIYDLSGKQATHLRPGINIVGGKKVLVK